MTNEKKTKLLTLITAMFVFVMAIFQVTVPAFADGSEDEEPVDAAVIAESGFDPDNLFATLEDDTSPDKQAKIDMIVAMFRLRREAMRKYPADGLVNLVEPHSLNDVQAIYDKAFGEFVIGDDNLGVGYEQAKKDKEDLFNKRLGDIEEIRNADKAEFDKFQTAAASGTESKDRSVKSEYEKLKAGFDEEGLEELGTVYGTYVGEDGEFLNPVEYSAKDVKECRKAVEALRDEAKEALKAVPGNPLDRAYNIYMDCLDGHRAPNEDELKKMKDGLRFYNDYPEKRNADAGAYYYTVSEYVNDEYPAEPSHRKNVLEDKDHIAKITASYADGTAAEVFGGELELFIRQGKFQTQSRDATLAMKELDGKLSTAYFIDMRPVTPAGEWRELKEKFAGKSVSYEIVINLKEYAKKFDLEYRTENIQGALERVGSDGALSLCYLYDAGNLEKIGGCKLEGEELRFTVSALKNGFCVAGTGLDSVIGNPVFWLVMLILLIVILIVIRILVKYLGYTIRFDVDGGSPVKSIRAAKNEYVILPPAPVKPGYVFGGWYTDKELTTRFIELRMKKRHSLLLHAKWIAPLQPGRLTDIYDLLRDTMRTYRKVSFKPVMGLEESELLATMYLKEGYIELDLAIDKETLESKGVVYAENDNPEVPVRINITTEEDVNKALELIDSAFKQGGLQKNGEYVKGEPSTDEDRKTGFAYCIYNDRVAKTAEDFTELMRIALKSYVLKEESEKFKKGDQLTLARLYITDGVACIHLPMLPGDKDLGRPSLNQVFEDTPVVVSVSDAGEMREVYGMIDRLMTANGFVKCPENANDLMDVELPESDGFAYTLKF